MVELGSCIVYTCISVVSIKFNASEVIVIGQAKHVLQKVQETFGRCHVFVSRLYMILWPPCLVFDVIMDSIPSTIIFPFSPISYYFQSTCKLKLYSSSNSASWAPECAIALWAGIWQSSVAHSSLQYWYFTLPLVEFYSQSQYHVLEHQLKAFRWVLSHLLVFCSSSTITVIIFCINAVITVSIIILVSAIDNLNRSIQ